MIPNPNAPVAAESEVPAGKREAVAARLQAIIAGWPATDESGTPITHISVAELAARLRTSLPPGVVPAQVSDRRVRALLRGLGYAPE